MAETITITVPNRHSKEEARRRIDGGFNKAIDHLAGKAQVETAWIGDEMSFKASAMGQSVTGTLSLFDDHVRIDVALPWLLAKLAGPISQKLEKNTQLLLK